MHLRYAEAVAATLVVFLGMVLTVDLNGPNMLPETRMLRSILTDHGREGEVTRLNRDDTEDHQRYFVELADRSSPPPRSR